MGWIFWISFGIQLTSVGEVLIKLGEQLFLLNYCQVSTNLGTLASDRYLLAQDGQGRVNVRAIEFLG